MSIRVDCQCLAYIKVLLDSLRVDTLGNDHNTPVHREPYEDLGRRLAIFLSNLSYLWVFQQRGVTGLSPRSVRGAQRTVGGDGNALVLAVLDEGLLRQIGVDLHLQHSWLDVGNSQDLQVDIVQAQHEIPVGN